MAYPPRYLVDPAHAGDERMKKCVEACEYDAIELDMQPRTISAKIGGIIWATGSKDEFDSFVEKAAKETTTV